MAGIVVLKVGGSLQGQHLDAVVTVARAIQGARGQVAIVHGGGPRISSALAQAGIEAAFVDGQRVTTPAAMVVVERVLAREVNPEIVAELNRMGLPAVGLSGAAGVLYAQPIPHLDCVGRVRRVDCAQVAAALDSGQVPVIAPVGCDEADRRFNINADLAASALAGGLGARRAVFLTDVAGIYSDFATKELLAQASGALLRELQAQGRFVAGMIPKVEAVTAALAAGVRAAFVVNGANPKAVLWAAQSALDDDVPEGIGTRILAE